MSGTKTNVDFLLIGAQRSGSTWLWRNLKRHPAIWMPPRKELHYFDRDLHYPTPSFLATNLPLRRLLSRESHNRRFRVKFFNAIRATASTGRWTDCRWLLRYFLSQPNDQWYRSLFATAPKGALKGESTPAYSILDEQDIRSVKNLFPELKVIFVMRNPIDRDWSQVRFYCELEAHKGLNVHDEKVIKQLLISEDTRLRSDYLRTLKNWLAAFPSHQISIRFYDELLENPCQFLANVFAFLGVSDSECSQPSMGTVNVSKACEMPNTIRRFTSEYHLPMLRELSSRFGGYPARWLLEAEKTIASDRAI